jgi:S-DNA-T family DNA segregation ATPase FtsK/SpoIIIE
VAIKDPTSTCFRRQAATNLMVLGQSDDSAMALSTAALLSLAAQYRSDQASFVVLDGSAADDPAHGMITDLAAALPHPSVIPGFRESDDAILQVGTEVARRVDGGITDAPSLFLFIHALQRFRNLRKSEDDFGYSFDEDEKDKPPSPDKVLATILREGPVHGVHVVTWCDTVASLQRCFDRQSISEFDQRALFQIGATDSSTLIDSPAASRLGFNRALLFSEEQGTMEKFRPWTMHDRDWLQAMATRLSERESGG